MKTKQNTIQNFLENIAESIPGNFYWKDNKGNYLGCNTLLIQALNFPSKDAMIGKNDKDLWPDNAAELLKNDLSIIKSGKPQFLEETVTLEGKIRCYTVIKTPLVDENNKIIGIIGNSIDITNLKETQQALAEQIKKTENAYRSKAEFLQTASHEIRNPISGVISYLDILKSESEKIYSLLFGDILDTLNKAGKSHLLKEITSIHIKQIRHFNETSSEAWRSLHSLTNLGELHTLQTEGIKVVLDDFNINDLLNDAIKNSTYPNNDKVDIKLYIDSEIPKEAIFDHKNIYEALRIIIGNAIRFSNQDDSIKIKVADDTINKQKFFVISVQDFGCGISETQLNDLFSYSLDKEQTLEKKLYSKPSIQLTQAKIKTEASGGILDIKSKLDQGTTVFIKFPYQLKEKSKANLTPNIEKQNKASNEKHQVLVVEDDKSIQKVLAKYLTELNYDYSIASTGYDAINMATKNHYDVILLDITLPGMNGLEVMREIQSNSENKPIFITITSHASDDNEDYFLSQGIMLVLKKPVNQKELKNAIEAALEANAYDDE